VGDCECETTPKLACYSYNSRDGGYCENTDLLGNRANRHNGNQRVGLLHLCQTVCESSSYAPAVPTHKLLLVQYQINYWFATSLVRGNGECHSPDRRRRRDRRRFCGLMIWGLIVSVYERAQRVPRFPDRKSSSSSTTSSSSIGLRLHRDPPKKASRLYRGFTFQVKGCARHTCARLAP
jgi:hypothetical protein